MRILVVEDEPDIADFVVRGLRESGYVVDVAGDGPGALACAGATAFDLIVLDWMLPGRSGLEVCRELRDQGRAMPILMLTARDAVEDRVRGLDCGADDYLVKPFAFRELLARIRALLRRPAAAPSETYHVGDLVIDTRTRRCARAGRSLDLTAREFAILELLARRASHVLTREVILDAVWDYRYEGGSNVVDVHVRNLRRKLDEPFDEPLIETVRGVGYRLRAPEGS